MIPMMLHPIDKAVTDTLETLRTVKDTFNADKDFYDSRIPSDSVELFAGRLETVILRFEEEAEELRKKVLGVYQKDEKKSGNLQSDNIRLLILHYANEAIFEGMHVKTDPYERFCTTARGIGILYKGSDILPALMEKENSLLDATKYFEELPVAVAAVLPDKLRNTYNSAVEAAETCNSNLSSSVLVGNELTVRAGLAAAAFKSASEEIVKSECCNCEKVNALTEAAVDFTEKGLKYRHFTEENENRITIQDYIVHSFAMGL